MDLTREVELTQVRADGMVKTKDLVVREVPLTVLVNGKELATLQCTPDRLEYLAVGFLLSEGLIKKDTEIKGITLNEKGWYIRVEIADDDLLKEGIISKRVIGTGCAGGISFYRAVDAKNCLPLKSGVLISKEKIFPMMKEFLGMSNLHRDTHGVHSAALCSRERIEIFTEDIGRHNAIDKIIGECFLKGIDAKKDQSYFLFSLSQEQLGRLIFPLGGYAKKDVRRILGLTLPIDRRARTLSPEVILPL